MPFYLTVAVVSSSPPATLSTRVVMSTFGSREHVVLILTTKITYELEISKGIYNQ